MKSIQCEYVRLSKDSIKVMYGNGEFYLNFEESPEYVFGKVTLKPKVNTRKLSCDIQDAFAWEKELIN